MPGAMAHTPLMPGQLTRRRCHHRRRRPRTGRCRSRGCRRWGRTWRQRSGSCSRRAEQEAEEAWAPRSTRRRRAPASQQRDGAGTPVEVVATSPVPSPPARHSRLAGLAANLGAGGADGAGAAGRGVVAVGALGQAGRHALAALADLAGAAGVAALRRTRQGGGQDGGEARERASQPASIGGRRARSQWRAGLGGGAGQPSVQHTHPEPARSPKQPRQQQSSRYARGRS